MSAHAVDRLIRYGDAFETQFFMVSIIVDCPRCPACPHVFQLTYTYEARKPGVKEKIVEMAFNGSGVRDTACVLTLALTPSCAP
jgi:transposase-like protein